MKYLSVLLFCLCCSDAGAGVFPNGRTINWAPGLEYRNGIPNRTGLINVKLGPYNAAGDSVTDDTLAIQAAINAAQANQVVYLPASTYLISGRRIMSAKGTPTDKKASHDARDDETVDLVIGIGEADGQILDDTKIDPETLDIFAGKAATFA